MFEDKLTQLGKNNVPPNSSTTSAVVTVGPVERRDVASVNNRSPVTLVLHEESREAGRPDAGRGAPGVRASP